MIGEPSTGIIDNQLDIGSSAGERSNSQTPKPDLSLVQKETSEILPLDLMNLSDRKTRASAIDSAWKGDPEYDLTRINQIDLLKDLLGKLKRGEIDEEQVINILASEEAEQIVASSRDELTQLHRRDRWKPHMEIALGIDRKNNKKTAVIFADIDGLKPANDKHGHETGNVVLVTAANVIKSNIREADVAVRYGGDENVIGLSGVDEIRAIERAEKIRSDIEKSEALEMHNLGINLDRPITTSVGVFVTDPEDQTPVDVSLSEATEAADTAMYVAKSLKGNRVIHAFKTADGSLNYRDTSPNGKTYTITKDEQGKIIKIEAIV